MKLQHLSAFAFVLLGLTSLACSAPDDEIFMGSDDGGSGGSSAGTQEPGSGAGMASSGKSQGGSASGGSSNKAGNSNEGGSSSGGTGKGGTAAAGSPSGGTGPAPWEPCAGKACGDVCQPCDPKDATCVALAVEMTCSSTGECSVGLPACTIPKCEGTQKYYAPGCEGPSPIAYPLFAPGCYDSCADTTPAGDACPDGYTCKLVWHDPSAGCVPGGESCIAACGAEAPICLAN